METFRLNSVVRDIGGKGAARKIRATGRIPAVLYGHKETPLNITVDESEMRAVLKVQNESAIVDLSVGSDAAVNVLVREVQRHPASGKLLHIDFQRISQDEKVRVDVHVEVEGDPLGVKEQGGMLEHGTRSVTVMCLPREIPDVITIDVAALEIGDAIKLKDIHDRFPALDFIDDDETTLATVIPPRLEAEPTAEEAEEAAEGEEPEIVSKEGEEKKEEDESDGS
jgi:large subunit ribosomal protein L25